MASKYQLLREISQLETLKEDLRDVVDNLTSASQDISKIHTTLVNHYKINEETNSDMNKAVPRAKKLEKDVTKENDKITGTVIPAIDKKIEENKKEIERIEREEAERRAAAASRSSSYRTYRRW